MDHLKRHFYEVFLILLLLLVYAQFSESLKYRQNNVCANHVMGEFVANPQDCRLFFLCGENGEAVNASCPLNMVFNTQNKLCDTLANAKCEQTIVTDTATATDSVTESNFLTVQQHCRNAYDQQPNSDSLIFLAHPSKCNQYYMCYYGQALLQECSTDLQWNSRIGKCDLPKNVKCKAKDSQNLLSIAPTQTAPLGGNRIACPIYGQHIFPHIQRCNMFIYCVKGHAILQQCPFYQYFDVENGRCKWRPKALCIKDLKLEYHKNTF